MSDCSDYISEDIYDYDACEEDEEEDDDRDPVDKLFEENSKLETENDDLKPTDSRSRLC